MKKPSIFKEKGSQNKLNPTSLFKYPIKDRYFFAHPFLFEGKTNFHLGFDTKQKKIIFLLSKQFSKSSRFSDYGKSLQLDFMARFIGEDHIYIKGIRYMCYLYEKRGCLFEEILQQTKFEVLEWFYLLIVLFMEFLSKIEKQQINIKNLDIKSLIFSISPLTKKLQFEVLDQNNLCWKLRSKNNKNYGENMLYDEIRKKLELIQVRDGKPDFNHQYERLGWEERSNTNKPSMKRNFKLILLYLFQFQTQIFYYRKKQSGTTELKESQLVFRKEILKIFSKLDKANKQLDSPQQWLAYIHQQSINSHIDIKSLKSRAKKHIGIINKIDQHIASKLCSQLRFNVLSQQNFTDFEIQQIEQRQPLIEDLINSHLMFPQWKKV